MAEAMSKQIELLKERIINWRNCLLIGPPSEGSSSGFGIIGCQIVGGSDQLEEHNVRRTSRPSRAPLRFYTSTALFHGSFQQDQIGFHEILDQSMQRAKEASEYIGIVGQQILSGRGLDEIDYPTDLLANNSGLRRDKLDRFEGLRPGLCVHIESTKQVRNHIEYVIWVCDIQSGVEWRISRRFRQFQEFHDILLCIRPSLASYEFPHRSLNVAKDDEDLINKRVKVLQKFLFKIASIISVSYSHPATTKVTLALQNFLGIDESMLKRFYAIESAMQKNCRFLIFRKVECYVQSLFCLRIMERVIDSFVNPLCTQEIDEEDFSLEKSQEVTESLNGFINNLQTIIVDSIYEDAKLIALRYNFSPECIKYLGETSGPSSPNRYFELFLI